MSYPLAPWNPAMAAQATLERAQAAKAQREAAQIDAIVSAVEARLAGRASYAGPPAGARPLGPAPAAMRPFPALGGKMAQRLAVRRALMRNRLTPNQAAQARSINAEVKTPVGIQTVTLGAPGAFALGQGVNVTRAIPPNSILWVTGSGFTNVDNVTAVLVDGKNIFINNQLPASAIDPTIFHAGGLIIPEAITQNITVQGNGQAGVVSAYLMAPSIEIEGILEAAAECACD